MRWAVAVFPGSSGGADCYHAIEEVLGEPVSYVWHQEEDLSSYDAILLPGGFSYGDYLRAGALARFSPVMKAVRKAADQGKLVIGIGNGFQILLEMGLLPGTMLRNQHLQFRCAMQAIRVENNTSPFAQHYTKDEVIQLPIAHGEGNYFCDEETLAQLQKNQQILLSYEGENPNGSMLNIAGISNEKGNVVGMMPHPERAIVEWMGSTDGVKVFTSMLQYWKENGDVATGTDS